MQRRVVVTGIGVISAVGHNWCEFWRALREGRSGIGPLEAVDTTLLRFQNGAEVRNYIPANHFDEKEIGLLDRFAQFVGRHVHHELPGIGRVLDAVLAAAGFRE